MRKKLLILLTVFFSSFVFVDQIFAATYNYLSGEYFNCAASSSSSIRCDFSINGATSYTLSYSDDSVGTSYIGVYENTYNITGLKCGPNGHYASNHHSFQIQACGPVGRFPINYKTYSCTQWIDKPLPVYVNLPCSMSNGKCGTANGKTYPYNATGYTPDTQCVSGSSSNTTFPSAGSSISWTCSGTDGGVASTTCTASRIGPPINGACGPAATTYYYIHTTYPAAQCSSGTPSNTAFPAIGSSVSWTCSGQNGGVASTTCTASRTGLPINGSCGIANGKSFSSAPTSGLCNSGEPLYFSGSGPWSWYCGGSNGGTSEICSANTSIAGSCGTANNKTYAYNVTAYSPDTQCSSGSSSNTAFPGQGSVVAWTCSGQYGGEARSCAAGRNLAPINGSCGTAARSYAYNVTSYSGYSQCSSGSSSNTTFPNPGGSVSWTCSGQNGGSASTTCTASRAATPVAGACGTANNKTYAYNVTSYGSDTQCSSGSSSNTAFPGQGSVVAWTCSGTAGGETRSCAAGRNLAPINGVCGPATTTYSGTATAYSGAQCTSGTASNTAFPAAGSSVSWTCSGTNGGNPSPTCTASRSKANSINLTLFKNAFDLLPTDTKSGSEEQCLWCEWYEKNTLVSGINETGLGKAGSLGFSFYYTDNINYRL
ncbi:hypothetical protein M0R01_01330, partial [bacterium]|nr:hypothetical protein [bacterium]